MAAKLAAAEEEMRLVARNAARPYKWAQERADEYRRAHAAAESQLERNREQHKQAVSAAGADASCARFSFL